MQPPNTLRLWKSKSGHRHAMEEYDTRLAAISGASDIPLETAFVETRYGPTHVIIAGEEDAPPVVLWHDQNSNATTWSLQISTLAHYFRVYAPDTIGSMGKSAPSRPHDESDSYGKWAADTIRALGASRAHHVGCGMGGWLILKLAAVAPAMIDSAVLISSGGFSRTRVLMQLRVIPSVLLMSPEMAARSFLRYITPPLLPVQDEDVRFYERMLRDFRPEPDVPVLSNAAIQCLAAPAYVMVGEYERLYNPTAIIKRARQLLPDLKRWEIIRGVGHFMASERPEMINPRLQDFIEKRLAG
jgi:pimeloyl-ACP methyl ester carboxylesterase